MKTKVEYTVCAAYSANLYWDDHNYNGSAMDRKLEKVVKKGSDGSGLGFGERDISWTFFKKEDALKAVKRIRAFAKKIHRRIKVTTYNYDH